MMDEKKLIELSVEEQAWCEQNKAWIETDPIRAKSLKEALEGKKISVFALRGFIEKKKEEALLATQGVDAQSDEQTPWLFIPGLTEDKRAMPNHIVRSSMFGAVMKKVPFGTEAFMHRGTELATRSDAKITYWGPNLYESHADIIMHLIFLANKRNLGSEIFISRADILKELGWPRSGESYRRLEEHLNELTASSIIVEAFKSNGQVKYKTESFKVLSKYKYDEALESYVFILDKEWKWLFSNKEYSLLDNQKRLSIKKNNLAKSLQRLFASSKDNQQAYELDYLRKRVRYDGRKDNFTSMLDIALEELERVSVIYEWNTSSTQLTIWKTPPRLAEHL